MARKANFILGLPAMARGSAMRFPVGRKSACEAVMLWLYIFIYK